MSALFRFIDGIRTRMELSVVDNLKTMNHNRIIQSDADKLARLIWDTRSKPNPEDQVLEVGVDDPMLHEVRGRSLLVQWLEYQHRIEILLDQADEIYKGLPKQTDDITHMVQILAQYVDHMSQIDKLDSKSNRIRSQIEKLSPNRNIPMQEILGRANGLRFQIYQELVQNIVMFIRTVAGNGMTHVWGKNGVIYGLMGMLEGKDFKFIHKVLRQRTNATGKPEKGWTEVFKLLERWEA